MCLTAFNEGGARVDMPHDVQVAWLEECGLFGGATVVKESL